MTIHATHQAALRDTVASSHAPGVNLGLKPWIAYVGLCILIFSAGVVSTSSAGLNAMIVEAHEAVFVLGYLLFLGPVRRIAFSARGNPVPYVLGAVWALSVTISLVWSPLGMGHELLGQLRYQQTLLHVLTFLTVRDLLDRYPLPRQWVLLAIPASALLVALATAYLVFQLDAYDEAASREWFGTPPLNGHIRYMGYQATAAIAALLPFFLASRRAPLGAVPLAIVLATLCTFLFWMAGRASIASACAAFGFVAIVASVRGVRGRSLWLAFSVAMIAGMILAEVLAVFPWNGVLSSVTRTVEAENLTRVTSGRLTVWREAWESVQPHLAFGLGPQGYLFMPNRSFGVQPHSLLVQFVVEWGLVGMVLFLTLLALGVWRGVRAHLFAAGSALDLPALSAGAVIVALSIHGLVDGTYFHPQPSLYLAIAFAVWTLPNRNEKTV